MASPSQADFETLKGDFEVLSRQLSEGLQPKIDDYDATAAQFATWRTTVDMLLSSQDKNHRELYDLANIHISEIKAQMGEMQKAMVAGGGGGAQAGAGADAGAGAGTDAAIDIGISIGLDTRLQSQSPGGVKGEGECAGGREGQSREGQSRP